MLEGNMKNKLIFLTNNKLQIFNTSLLTMFTILCLQTVNIT